MKHTAKVTIILLTFFIVAQYIGLNVLYNSIDLDKSIEGETVYKDLPFGERPPVDEKISFIPIIVAIIIGTLFLLLLIKLNWTWVWKIWFLLAITIALTTAFGTYMSASIAMVISLGLGIWRTFKPNFWVQNLTELFIYGGLAVIFVPLFNLWSVSILLVLIAIYDAYAVWRSKHMVTLAKSQMEAKVFAGLYIPYTVGKIKSKVKSATKKVLKKAASKVVNKSRKVPVKVKSAILGGGDIGFPLIFAGVVMKEIGLWQSLIIPPFALAGLGFLLWKGNRKKFYPAMPFIGVGCFIGLGIVWLISLVI
jgi:presenilin-like A22 family membrane protease